MNSSDFFKDIRSQIHNKTFNVEIRCPTVEPMETDSSVSPIDYSELLLQEINEYYPNLCNEDRILLSIVKYIAESKTISGY